MIKQKSIKFMLDPLVDKAVPMASDPDFDSDDDDTTCGKPKKKKPKLQKADGPHLPTNENTSILTKESTKPTKLIRGASRLQACGEKDMDKCACAADDNGDDVKVVFFHLSIVSNGREGIDGSGHEHIFCADRRGARYDLYPNYEKDQSTLGESEFVGFFYTNVDGPGVADEIITVLEDYPTAHVVIVDKKGVDFCRLLAWVVVAKMKKRNARLADNLKEGLKRPIQKEFKEVVNKILKAKSEVLMRQLARDLYETMS